MDYFDAPSNPIWIKSPGLVTSGMDDDTLRARFQELLRKIREEAGFNQTQLAAMLGKTQAYISKIELGERGLDFRDTVDFCAACNVSIAEFVARLGAGNPQSGAHQKRQRRRLVNVDDGAKSSPQEVANSENAQLAKFERFISANLIKRAARDIAVKLDLHPATQETIAQILEEMFAARAAGIEGYKRALTHPRTAATKGPAGAVSEAKEADITLAQIPRA